VGEIFPTHVRRYLAWRRTHGPHGEPVSREISKRTRQLDRAVLRLAFEQAVDDGYISGNPVSKKTAISPDPRTPVILSDPELESLLAACRHNPFLHLFVLTLAETGARSESEALWLRWEDVHLEDGFIWIDSGRDHRTKSGKGRWVPMTTSLASAMRSHFAEYRFRVYGSKTSLWVFHHRVGKRSAKAGDRIASLRSGFEKACRDAGMPKGFRQHDLRHRRVTTWLAEKRNPVHVKEAMGHSDIQTTMGYTHLAKEHLRSLTEEPEENRRNKAVS
jgi:integrase